MKPGAEIDKELWMIGPEIDQILIDLRNIRNKNGCWDVVPSEYQQMCDEPLEYMQVLGKWLERNPPPNWHLGIGHWKTDVNEKWGWGHLDTNVVHFRPVLWCCYSRGKTFAFPLMQYPDLVTDCWADLQKIASGAGPGSKKFHRELDKPEFYAEIKELEKPYWEIYNKALEERRSK